MNNDQDIKIDTLWMQQLTAAGINLKDVDPFREITEQELEYLRNMYPYVRLISPNAGYISEQNLIKKKAATGWQIFDYDNLIAISPGDKLFHSGNQKFIAKILAGKDPDGDDGDEGDGDDAFLPEAGTILQQALDTIEEIIRMALGRGWPYLKILDGSKIMKRMTWIKGEQHGWLIEGYSPSEEENKLLDRLRESDDEWQLTPTVLHI
ncbi:MAG: hypothetical protein JXR42_01595 [Gammaproteobacteria bacterium]|nr:hypothetical protein [Gammaproteobacteria bacterium]